MPYGTDRQHRKRGSADAEALLRCWQRLPDAIVTTSDTGVILYWHPSAERIYGHSAEEAVGQRLTDLLVPPEHVDAENRMSVEAIVSGYAIGASARRLKDGTLESVPPCSMTRGR
jgi:PAS domain S-box-containing protein